MKPSTYILFGLVLVLCGLTGCSSTMPNVVLYNTHSSARQGWYNGSMDRPDVWAKNLYGMSHDSTLQAITHADWAVDGAFYGVKEAANQLESLEEDGARFKVKMKESGKVELEVYKPMTASNVAQDAVAKLFLQPSREDWAEIMLDNVGRGARQLSIDSLPEVELRFYRTVTEIAEVDASKELDFALPEGLTREDYRKLLDVILVSFHNDWQEVKTSQAGLASTMAAVAALDSSVHGGVGNIYLVLNASMEDRKRFKKRREQLRDYPPEDQIPALREEATRIQAEAAASARYKEWGEESHAWREMSNFGSATFEAFSSLSAVYGAFGGVDLIGGFEDRMAEGVSVDLMLDVSLYLVPAGGELHAVLQQGKSAYEKATRLADAIEDPSAEASKLLMWAVPEEIQRATQRVKAMRKPSR